MAIKIQSSTGNATAEINGDKTAIIFKSKSYEAGIYWPLKDWDSLKRIIDGELKNE